MKLGIVGLGHLGKIVLSVLHHIPEIKLSGLYDIDQIRCQDTANQYRTKAFLNFNELLKNSDAIAIITPTPTHFDYAKQSIEYGKHVFIEKPATFTLSESQELLRLSNIYQVIVQIGHIERYNPSFQTAKPYLTNIKTIKAERFANYNVRGTDVSVVMDLSLHDLDIIISLINKPLLSIKAEGKKHLSNSADEVKISMVFSDNIHANIHTHRASLENKREIIFTTDELEVKCDLMNKRLFFRNLSSDSYKEISVPETNALVEEYRDFYNSIQHQKPLSIGLKEAINVLDLIKTIEAEI